MGELRQVTKAIFRHRIRTPRISGGPSQFCLGEYKPRDTTLTKLTDDTNDIFIFFNRPYRFLNDFVLYYSTGNDFVSSSKQHSPCERPIPRLPQTSGFSRTQSSVGSQESPKYSSQHQSERLSKCLQVHLLFSNFVLNSILVNLKYFLIGILTYMH